MWQIDKTFEFCYGHRVWTQKLNGEYADDLKCACRHLHGHEGKAQVFLEGDKLDPTGMVTDFRHLEWLKKWLNTYVDHQFILDINDPLFSYLLRADFEQLPTKAVFVPGTEHIAGWQLDLDAIEFNDNAVFEMFEGLLFVNFPPTSENLSRWLGEIAQVKMKKLGVKVSRIDWWETPKSRSTWIA